MNVKNPWLVNLTKVMENALNRFCFVIDFGVGQLINITFTTHHFEDYARLNPK